MPFETALLSRRPPRQIQKSENPAFTEPTNKKARDRSQARIGKLPKDYGRTCVAGTIKQVGVLDTVLKP